MRDLTDRIAMSPIGSGEPADGQWRSSQAPGGHSVTADRQLVGTVWLFDACGRNDLNRGLWGLLQQQRECPDLRNLR